MRSDAVPGPSRIPTVEGIPPELRALRQWVAWKWQDRNGKRTKVPLNSHTGAFASSTDATTWGESQDALAFCRRNPDSAGIGFVFSADDPYTGIDLDRCRDPVTGKVADWARQVIDYISSYTEVSPSGTGVKIFVRGRIGSGIKHGAIEAYDSRRYFTVTGDHVPGTPAELRDCGDRIQPLVAWLRPPPNRKRETTRRQAIEPDDARLVERAKRAANGTQFERLWHGDWSAYPSHSEADLALCAILAFWTSGDFSRVDRLFRASKLFRQKWDERHYGDGRTYGDATVTKALSETAVIRERSDGDGDQGRTSAVREEPEEPLETDLGNAVRMAAHHGNDIRYCFPTHTFHVWTGTHWPADRTGEVYRRAKKTVRSIFREAEKAGSQEQSKRLAQHAVRSQAEQRITAIVKLFRSEPGIPIVPAELDADPWLFNVENGTLNLRDGELRPHDRRDLITKQTPVHFDANAECPRWMAFLDRIMAGNDALIRFLQRAVGYSLTGDVSEQVIFFLHGGGANGKSTFISTVLELLGDYGKQAAPGLLTLKKGESHPTEIADLAGARFVAAVEVDEGRRLAEALTKWLSGADRIKARFMRQDLFEFTPTHKFWLAANHKPTITGTDNAMWRRLQLIPFQVEIPEAEQDRLLGNKLRQELPGILRWAVEGCLIWQRDGLAPPEEVLAATSTYRQEEDTLAGFLQECCEQGEGKKVTAKDLFAAYRDWCAENAEVPLSKKAFGTRLSNRGFTGGIRGTGGTRWWKGVGLVTHQSLDLDTSDG